MSRSNLLAYSAAILGLTAGLFLIARRIVAPPPRAVTTPVQEIEVIAEVGSPVPAVPLSVAGTNENLSSLTRGRWTLVLYRKGPTAEELEYPQILGARLGSASFGTVLVAEDTAQNRAFAAAHQVAGGRSQVKIALVSGNAFVRAFGLPPDVEIASLLITPDAKVAFSLRGFLRDGVARQLIEQFVLKKTPEELYRDPEGLTAGAPVPSALLTRFSPKSKVDLQELCKRQCTVMFFPAGCTRCPLTGIISELNQFSAKRGGFDQSHVIAVFSKRLTPKVAEAVAETGALSGWSPYSAEDYIRSWEDPYFADVPEFNRPRMVAIEHNSVLSVTDYRQSVKLAMAHATAPQRSTSPADRRDQYELEELFRDVTSTRLVSLYSPASGTPGGELYLADRGNSRISVIAEDGHLLRHIGQLGQGEGGLSNVLMATGSKDGKVYVVNGRWVQAYHRTGKYLFRFKLKTVTDSIAVSPAGVVYINSPQEGSVITACDSAGRTLRQFGILVPASQAYPGKKDSPELSKALGRAYLNASDDGGVYVSYQFAPVVQRYDPTGKLVWQMRFSGAWVSELVRTFWNEPGAKPGKGTKNMDGMPLIRMVMAATLTDKLNLAVLFADGTVAVVSPDGKQIAAIHRIPADSGLCEGFACSSGRMYFTSGGRCWRAPGEVTF